MTPITPEKLIELGFTLFHKWDDDCAYMFPSKHHQLIDYLLVSEDSKTWKIYSLEYKGNIRELSSLEQLDNFVHGMCDEWLIELEEDKFLENTY